MPIYEYRCDNGHTFEVMQRMTDDPVTECETCEAPVQRVFHPVAVHFKGSGFYNTDYGHPEPQARAREAASDGADKHEAKKKSKADAKAKEKSSSTSGGSSSPSGSSSTAKKTT